jgi:hypothetical protein
MAVIQGSMMGTALLLVLAGSPATSATDTMLEAEASGFMERHGDDFPEWDGSSTTAPEAVV